MFSLQAYAVGCVWPFGGEGAGESCNSVYFTFVRFKVLSLLFYHIFFMIATHTSISPPSSLFNVQIYAGGQFSFHVAWHNTLYATVLLPDKLVVLYTEVELKLAIRNNAKSLRFKKAD